MKILVAGGTGFLGSTIVDALLFADMEVGVLSRSRPANSRVSWVQGDVTDPTRLDEKLRGWQVVIDAVQLPNYPMENPRKGLTFERIDLGGTINLVDAAKAAGVNHFVGLSGNGAAEDAPYHWLRFKWQEEQHIIQSGVPYTIFRPSWVYGEQDVSLNRFLGFARFLPFVPIIGNGKTRISPIFVGDAAAYIANAAMQAPKNRIFELAGPQELTMDEIVKTALRVQGKKRLLLHHPVWFMKIVAGVAQFLPGRPLTPDAMDFVTMEGTADNTEVVEAFNIPMKTLEEGVSTYLR